MAGLRRVLLLGPEYVFVILSHLLVGSGIFLNDVGG